MKAALVSIDEQTEMQIEVVRSIISNGSSISILRDLLGKAEEWNSTIVLTSFYGQFCVGSGAIFFQEESLVAEPFWITTDVLGSISRIGTPLASLSYMPQRIPKVIGDYFVNANPAIQVEEAFECHLPRRFRQRISVVPLSKREEEEGVLEESYAFI